MGSRKRSLMDTGVQFEAVRRLLLEMGFTEKPAREGPFVFRHDSGALFIYKPYKPSDAISGTDLVSLEFHLDAWGFLERDAFKEWCRSVAV